MFEPCRELPHQQGERADTERVEPACRIARARRHGERASAMSDIAGSGTSCCIVAAEASAAEAIAARTALRV
jgi:hypothetical protein